MDRELMIKQLDMIYSLFKRMIDNNTITFKEILDHYKFLTDVYEKQLVVANTLSNSKRLDDEIQKIFDE